METADARMLIRQENLIFSSWYLANLELWYPILSVLQYARLWSKAKNLKILNES